MTLRSTQSDDELLRLMVEGDQEAFTAIYRQKQAGVYQFALHMSGSAATAEDITQEVFVVLINQADRYDPAKGSLAAFLYGVARNLLLRRHQRERVLVQMDSEQSHTDAVTRIAQTDPLGDLTRNEAIQTVRSAVLSLPPHYREVVVLCDLQELGYSEAAKVLGCPIGTVRSRLHRARGMLLDRLRNKEGSNDMSTEANSARCFA